jgi:putative ABC transport system permease protein
MDGDPALVLQPIRIDGEPYTVIGVMPAGTSVHFLDPPMWRPLAMAAAPSRPVHDLRWVVAKLKSGVMIAQARTQLDAIAARLAAQYPDSNKELHNGHTCRRLSRFC